MVEINWKKDYQKEFTCPNCNAKGMTTSDTLYDRKKVFECSTCRKRQLESCKIHIKAVNDPLNQGITWYTNSQIKDFLCPKCQDRNVYFRGILKGKNHFLCKSCKSHFSNSLLLNNKNIEAFSNLPVPVKPFNWSDDRWDLRSINPNFDDRDKGNYTAIFTDAIPDWFKHKTKKYIEHLCKSEAAMVTILRALIILRHFSYYLDRSNIATFEEINRSLILNYLTELQGVNVDDKARELRSFFTTGTLKGWFNIDQDIIRNSDFPKCHKGNPDPISNIVREKIE